MRVERQPPQHDPGAQHAGEHGEQEHLDDAALDVGRRQIRHVTAPLVNPSASARVLNAIAPRYVAPLEPFGPSESAHSGGPMRAPVWRAIACSTFGFTEDSAKIVRTPVC